MNKSMEYMAFELPVVAFDLRETRVSTGDAAVYVKPNDVRDYAEAIAELLDDEPKRALLGKLGRARVEQELAWCHQERAYLDVYQRLTAAPGRRQAGERAEADHRGRRYGRPPPDPRDAMKQIAQNYKSGELIVLDAPVPACRPGGVLVQSLFSLISTGTEMMKVAEAKMSMVGKARARPDQVRKVLDTVAQQGAMATYKKVMNRLDSYTPLGYSLCGVVIEVGRGPRSSASARSSQRQATSTPCTPSTTGSRSTCAPRSRGASHPSTPPSPPWVRSPCTACGAPRSSSATPPWSSASA